MDEEEQEIPPDDAAGDVTVGAWLDTDGLDTAPAGTAAAQPSVWSRMIAALRSGFRRR